MSAEELFFAIILGAVWGGSAVNLFWTWPDLRKAVSAGLTEARMWKAKEDAKAREIDHKAILRAHVKANLRDTETGRFVSPKTIVSAALKAAGAK